MNLLLELPDELASAGIDDPSRIAMEALASKAYENGAFSLEQVRRMLSLPTRWEAQEVLSRHHVWPGTTIEDLSNDLAVLESIGVKPS
jgi:predicted HTH domain antitoxin